MRVNPLPVYWGAISLAWLLAPVILLAILFGGLALSHRDSAPSGSTTGAKEAASVVLPVDAVGASIARLDVKWGVPARAGSENGEPAAPASIFVVSRNPVTQNTVERTAAPVVTRYSCEDVRAAMIVQGFSEEATRIGTGVVMAESHGDPSATAITAKERSVGPLQVNTLVHRYSDECLRSLTCSVAVAWKISSGGTNWTPWSSYKSGAYLGRCA